MRVTYDVIFSGCLSFSNIWFDQIPISINWFKLTVTQKIVIMQDGIGVLRSTIQAGVDAFSLILLVYQN